MKNIKKDKKGWIEIVEAFAAVLLVAGVLLFVISKGTFGKTDISQQVYTIQLSILREIQTNTTFRAAVTSPDSSLLPIVWSSSNFPAGVKDIIIKRTPNYLECVGQICSLEDDCTLFPSISKDVYAQEVTISGTLAILEYRKLKLFCWNK